MYDSSSSNVLTISIDTLHSRRVKVVIDARNQQNNQIYDNIFIPSEIIFDIRNNSSSGISSSRVTSYSIDYIGSGSNIPGDYDITLNVTDADRNNINLITYNEVITTIPPTLQL